MKHENKKLIMGTSYDIRIGISGASDKAIEELEKNIQEFINEQTAFKYIEYIEDKETLSKQHLLVSIN